MIAFEKHPNDDARWDNGVISGSIIGTDFDPMLAKIISWKKTREGCIILAKSWKVLISVGFAITGTFSVNSSIKEFLDGDTTSDFLEVAGISRGKHLTDQELNEVLVLQQFGFKKITRNM